MSKRSVSGRFIKGLVAFKSFHPAYAKIAFQPCKTTNCECANQGVSANYQPANDRPNLTMKECKMATFETTRPAPFGAETTYRIVSFFDAKRAALVEWNNARVTRDALSKLSDHELNDIGFSRGDVSGINGPSNRFF
jgi:uncharacterized protein YjiS (DUF1127 family)